MMPVSFNLGGEMIINQVVRFELSITMLIPFSECGLIMSVGNTVGDTKLLYVVILVSLKDLEFRDSKLLK
jgi:hypothetical protein